MCACKTWPYNFALMPDPTSYLYTRPTQSFLKPAPTIRPKISPTDLQGGKSVKGTIFSNHSSFRHRPGPSGAGTTNRNLFRVKRQARDSMGQCGSAHTG